MKLYQMYIRYIAAILLLTLSWCSQAAQCNEQQWNKALVSQQALDQKFNVLAKKYNQWLPTFHASVFLHQEFSQQELNYLWNKNVDKFQQKVEQQIVAALKSRQTVNELVGQVTAMPLLVEQQIRTWQQIQQACKNGNLITNEIATNHYIEADAALKHDLSDLVKRLQKLKSVYDREISTLLSFNDLKYKSP